MKKSDSFLSSVASTIARYGLVPTGSSILCAVSGGSDSVALLHTMMTLSEKLGIARLVACHFEHGIRGSESMQDQDFVVDLCRQWQIELAMGSADIPRMAKETGQGIETAARNARHAFFKDAMRDLQLDFCALGHHADDQAETVLMQLARGSRGALGMRPKQGSLIRPLIQVTKREIESYLASHHIPYRHDATNDVLDNPRNSLRLAVFPALQSIYPSAVAAIGRACTYMREDDDYLMQLAQAWTSSAVRRGHMSLQDIPEPPVFRRALCSFAKTCGVQVLSSEAIAHLERLATARTGSRYEIQGIVFEKTSNGILLVPPPLEIAECAVDLQGATTLSSIGWHIQVKKVDSISGFPHATAYTQYFDEDKLPPLLLRARQTGDTIHPFGATGHTSLKELFIDHKVPKGLRSRVPVLANGKEIYWAVGVVRSQYACVSKDTCRIVELTFHINKGD